jgi:hypothetical protein
MKKLIFMLVMLIHVGSIAQINPNEFPKIGYTDLHWLRCIPIYHYYPPYNGYNLIDTSHFVSNSYYYPLLSEMGLNYVVTLGHTGIPLNPNINNSIKIIDYDFLSYHKNQVGYIFHDVNYDISSIAYSTGNDAEFYAYQVGGQTFSEISSQIDNFGFGKEAGQSSTYSIWVKNRDTTIGEINQYDQLNNLYTFYAGVDEHSEGFLLRAKFPPLHQNSNHGGKEYYLSIRSRINPDPGGSPNDTVAVVSFGISTDNIETILRTTSPKIELMPDSMETEQITQPRIIRANEFDSNGNYSNIIIPFEKTNGSKKLTIDILWKDKRDLYIDKIAIYNHYYDSLFIKPYAIQTSIRNRIKSVLTDKFQAKSNNPLWAHAYHDEAMPLTYRCYKEMNELAQLPNVLGEGKYVTGVTNVSCYTYDQMRFAYNIWRPPYIMYEDYPILEITDSVSTNPSSGKHSLQVALQRLVGFDWGIYDATMGIHRNGLKYSIEFAQNYSGALNDDIPFYHTMQVCAQKNISDSVVNTVYNREPKPNEIQVQGWLAMCYGAKGLMYYAIYTNTPGPPLNTGGAIYGVFSSLGEENQNCQNPSLAQVPNERFYAVKELNQEIDKISPTLLQLTWIYGDSSHDTIPLTGRYITSVTSSFVNELNEQTVFDQTSEKFVELGFFKKTISIEDNYLDYFMVVNRRCLSNEGRHITIKLDKSSTGLKNWKVTDVATNTSYVVLDTGTVSIDLGPGRGKLFRLEPVMIAGGTLAYNETIPQNTSFQVKGNVIVPSGKTLTINSGSNLTFIDSSKLTVSGTLIINGTSNNKAKLDFTSGVTWRGLFLNPGSSATIDYAEIEDAYWGINANACSLLIQNSEIKNCYFGIYLYYTSYDYYGTEIRNCNIHNTIYGIELNHSAPLITNCIISGSENGISCISSSNVHLGNDEEGGLNIIGDGDLGVYSYASDPYLGIYDEKTEIGGYNSIVGAGYNVEAEMDSYVYAHLNWWGSSTPDPSEFKEDGGVIDYDYYLDYSPFGESQTPEEGGEEILVKGKTGQITLESLTTKAKYEKAVIHYLKNRKAEARVYCNSILDEEVENRLKYPALRLLVRCMDEDSVRTNVIGKINNTLLTTAQTDYNAYLEMTLADIVRSNYLTSLDGIMTKYRNTTYKPLILFRKFSYLYFEEENRDSARVIANIMEDLYPDHELTKSAKMMFGVTTLKKETEETSIIPKEYKLYQNYPNPFNPVTTIKYQLPANSKVTLTIYDILGKEVTKLVDKEQEAGKYQITFDAKRYASGVYICRIIAGDFVKTIKMSLVK